MKCYNGVFYATVLLVLVACNQSKKESTQTIKNAAVKRLEERVSYSGKYRNDYGGAGSGEINIWKLDDDSTAIFNIDLYNGRNLGNLTGKMNIKNNVGIFDGNKQIDSCFCECILRFDFKSKSVEVTSINSDCAFGYGVMGDGIYKKIGNDIPNSFVDMAVGDTVYFQKIKELFDKKSQIN